MACAQISGFPTPKKDPFAGFGNALDQRPSGYKQARPSGTPSQLSTTHIPATNATGSQLPSSQLAPAGNSLTFEAKLVSNGGANKVDRGGSSSAVQTTETAGNQLLLVRASANDLEAMGRNLSKLPGL